MKLLGALILALCHFGTVRLDYDCMCCYTVEEKVHGEARADGKPIGYMYEFDCKKIMKYDSSKQFVPIEFEHQLGYVEEGTNMQKEICPGDPPDTDTIFTSTTLSTMVSTTSLTSTKTTTDVPDSASTSSATITSKSTTRPSTTTAKTTTDKPTPMPTTTTTKTTTDKSTTLPTTTTTKTTTAKTTTRPTTTITKSKTSSTTKLSSTEKTFTISTPATPSPSTTVRTTTSTIKHISSTTPPAVSSSPSLTSTSRPPAPVMTTTVSITTAPNVQNEFNTTDSPLGFIGVGYDLYHGNPGGVARTQDGGDPGILLSKRIFQMYTDMVSQVKYRGCTSDWFPVLQCTKQGGLTVDSMSINSSAREVDIVMSPSCSNMKTTVVVNDGKSYQSELLRHVTFPNSYPRNQKSDAFVYNKEFMGIRHDTEETLSAIFTDITYSCYLDTLRYKNENASSSQFSITRGFARDVCNLDEHFNITQYRTFIDDWGTNVVMATKLGTMKVERFKTKEQTLIERLQALKQSVSVLYHTGQYKGYNSSLTINSTALATLNAPGIFGTLMNTATIGTPSSPVPVDLTLYPITEALDPDYWMPIFRQALFGDICGTLNQSKLANIKTNLDFALKQYSSYLRAKENLQNVQPLKAHAIQVPLTWPHGTYGLMKSTAGCPSGRVAWQEGFRKYDTEDIRAHNTFSQNIQNYMAGSYAADNIVSVFCMKTHVATNVVYERDWPRGTYCILRFGTCPANFGEGYIYWDDDDGVPPFVGNHNDEGGTLPFGSYGKNTKIHYCCRNDAPQSDPIYMPREMPFILMMFGSKCQHVHGMVMHELYVRWDDEDVGNKDSAGGAHPTDYGGSHDHLLHFCYYSLDDISFPVNNVLVG